MLTALTLAQAGGQVVVEDEFGLAIVVFFLLLILGLIWTGIAVVVGIGALLGAGVAAVALGVLMMLAAAFAGVLCAHLVLATVVWTRRPPRRVWCSRRVWAIGTVFFGLVSAVPFFWLHYRRRGMRSCFKCGYALAQLNVNERCPECGVVR